MRTLRQKSNLYARHDFDKQNILIAERALEQSAWGRGIYIPGRVVPAARPAQIKAGARKLYDVIRANARREQKKAAQA
jgi:hypothetical protein